MTLLLLLGIVLVFASPAVNLSPTALRASRAAQRLVLTLAAFASLVSLFSTLPTAKEAVPFSEATSLPPDDLLNRICARLC
ncbi:MAG TPA: hypothetical protein VGG46_02775 [Terriglobales bacterium]